MIIDTSALVAILYREPEAADFTKRILDAESCRLSVASLLELTMVVVKQLGVEGAKHSELFVSRAGIVVEPVSVEQGKLARQAFLDFGKGRHPAALNFGDCFAYALAKAMDEPLLFKGEDFRRTDVRCA